MEEKQVFKNGNVRERGFQFVAEKMQLGESSMTAAIRGLAEELQISGQDIHVSPLVEENKSKFLESSPTYLGISSSYQTYSFKCEIPKTYYHETYIEDQDDKQTFFSWIKI